MILYRSVGLQELELIYDNGMKAFPARLAQQPIFYPVLELEYARQIASDWNVKNGQFAGYVTQFKVQDDYIGKFEKHTVGGTQHQEYWIPAEEMEEFNQHITGHIKILEAHFGDAFQGFVPEKFVLQGKNAAEQFTLLANTYLYKRMDFYLEIKRNHKAVFLNYPFWLKHDFKNPGLKDKIVKAIKEAWFTSFPQTPLPNPVQEETTPPKQTDSRPLAEPVHEEIGPVRQTNARAFRKPVHEDLEPIEQPDPEPLSDPDDEDVFPAEQISLNPLDQDPTPVEQTNSHFLVKPVREDMPPSKQTDSHFVQGVKLGLSGEYAESIRELAKAVEEDPDDVDAHTSLGIAFHRLGEEDQALACYETALKIDPIYAEAHYFRANILYSHGNVREAIAGYTVAIGLKPELIEAHEEPAPQDRLTDYARAPSEMRWIAKPAHRILDLNKLLESNPRRANLFKERAAEYYRLRNYAQAIADYSAALAIHPEDTAMLHSRGLAYEQLGQVDHALEDYQQALALNPQLSNDYINRGVTFGQMGNHRQSIANLTEGIRLAPKNPDGYFNRGIIFFQQGDFENAIADFSMVIQLSPSDEEAYYWRGISHEASGRQREAIADYRKFLTLSQNPRAKEEIEQKLRQWNQEKQNSAKGRGFFPSERQKINQVPSEQPDQNLDLHGLIVALGERAINSTWFGSGASCYGERAEELYAFTDRNRPINGRDLLDITAGISRTIAGDFQGFDPGATSTWWILIRAWEGTGFYVETNDPKIKEFLKGHFESAEDVEGVSPPYEGLFIRI